MMLGAVLDAAVLAAAHPAPKVKVPAPGGIGLRVLRIDATLRAGQVAPAADASPQGAKAER
jgi:hypothetical protein